MTMYSSFSSFEQFLEVTIDERHRHPFRLKDLQWKRAEHRAEHRADRRANRRLSRLHCWVRAALSSMLPDRTATSGAERALSIEIASTGTAFEIKAQGTIPGGMSSALDPCSHTSQWTGSRT